MGDELGTSDGGSDGSTPDFAGVFLLLEERQHQARGLVLNSASNTVDSR